MNGVTVPFASRCALQSHTAHHLSSGVCVCVCVCASLDSSSLFLTPAQHQTGQTSQVAHTRPRPPTFKSCVATSLFSSQHTTHHAAALPIPIRSNQNHIPVPSYSHGTGSRVSAHPMDQYGCTIRAPGHACRRGCRVKLCSLGHSALLGSSHGPRFRSFPHMSTYPCLLLTHPSSTSPRSRRHWSFSSFSCPSLPTGSLCANRSTSIRWLS